MKNPADSNGIETVPNEYLPVQTQSISTFSTPMQPHRRDSQDSKNKMNRGNKLILIITPPKLSLTTPYPIQVTNNNHKRNSDPRRVQHRHQDQEGTCNTGMTNSVQVNVVAPCGGHLEKEEGDGEGYVVLERLRGERGGLVREVEGEG